MRVAGPRMFHLETAPLGTHPGGSPRGSVIGTANGRQTRPMPMTARCASATNPVAPGTASVIPPRKGYARLTRIEFETIYSAADAAWEPPTPRVNQSLGSPAVLIDLVLVKGRGRSVWVGLRVAPELANADLEQGHVVVHLAVGAPVQYRHPLPQLSL